MILLLLGIKFYPHRLATDLAPARPTPTLPIVLAAERRAAPQPLAEATQRDSLVRFALRQVGIPYLYAGTSPISGFDCSGFVMYVFAHFGVPTPHATALLIDVGQPVARADARPGDIVVFTGTAPTSTTPGHAGIVISALGETPLRFVHASSARRESGVKVSQVENSDYERRFMQVRRILAGSAGGLGTTPAPRVTAAARPASAVAPLATAATKPVAAPAVPLPTSVSPVAVPARIAGARLRRVVRPKAIAHHPGQVAAKSAPRRPAPRKVASRLAASKKAISRKAPTPPATAKHRRATAPKKAAKH
ncbi:MAG: NlpC/P60 family protein [Janthinobacterium lividum]